MITSSTSSNAKFAQNRWGGLAQSQLPCSIFASGSITLKTDALVMLMTLHHVHRSQMRAMSPELRHRSPVARVIVSQAHLSKISGFHANTISKATKKLAEAGFVEIARRYKSTQLKVRAANKVKPNYSCGVRSLPSEYLLLNGVFPDPAGLLTKGQLNILPANLIPYIIYPICVLSELQAAWSLSRMSISELKLYVCLLWMANANGETPSSPHAENCVARAA